MTKFIIGDAVRVLKTRVHKHEGKVIGILPVRVRVEFPHGGYGNTPYIEDFRPERLEKTSGTRPAEERTEAQASENKEGN
jgi:hypothetical protein